MLDLTMDRLRRGLPVSDADFDVLFPDWARRFSRVHWTPVEVARRAVEILAPAQERILDVGSGVGKLCLVGALTSNATFYGIEHRARCVEAACQAATRAGTRRARFIHGNMIDLSWGGFDGFYLYNPFVENLYSGPPATPEAIDEQYVRSKPVFDTYVDIVVDRLRHARVGTRVVTYHGFGGTMPDCFEQIVAEEIGSDFIEAWVKTRVTS